MIITPEIEVLKNNRLAMMLDLHRQRTEIKENTDMASKGICEACEDHSLQLKPRGDKQLCGKCRTIFSNVANWLPVVEMALAEVYPEKYGPGAVIIGGSEGTLKRAVDQKTEAVLKRIAAAVGYEGEDPEKLADMVDSVIEEKMAIIMAFQANVERMKLTSPTVDVFKALSCGPDNWHLAAIQTAAILDNAEIEFAAANTRLTREEQLGELYREELAVCRGRLEVATAAAWIEEEPAQTSLMIQTGPLDQAERKAAEHWEYIKGVLEVHNVTPGDVDICGHHYRTAFVHGWKHRGEAV